MMYEYVYNGLYVICTDQIDLCNNFLALQVSTEKSCDKDTFARLKTFITMQSLKYFFFTIKHPHINACFSLHMNAYVGN